MPDLPKTLLDAVRYFSDASTCNEYMRRIKWPGGKITCPKCGGESVSDVKGRPKLQCNSRACKKQFSYKVGTIFEDSPLGLDKWFVAVWSVANCKNGISSHELGRALGVEQRTAWFMLHRIRKAMEADGFDKLDGEVEVDETYVGGKSKNRHASRREDAPAKTAVQGILKRGGEVRTFVVTQTDAIHLQPTVQRNELPSHSRLSSCSRLSVVNTLAIGIVFDFCDFSGHAGVARLLRGGNVSWWLAPTCSNRPGFSFA